MKVSVSKQIKFILATMMVLNFGCGAKDDENAAEEEAVGEETNSIVSDESLSNEAASIGLTDALEALSDSNDSSASSSALALSSAEVESSSDWDKTCVEVDDTAKVTVTGTIDRSITLDRPRFSATHTVSGKNSVERLWSMDDGAVTCHENGRRADIDWSSDLTGLNLDVTIDRSRQAEITRTNKRSGKSFTMNREFSVAGTRNIQWISHSADEAEGTITRTKEIDSEITRTHKHENSKGLNREMEFTVKKGKDAPLVVEVVWDSSDLSLKSKTIKSGIMVAERKNDGKVESEFSLLKAVFTDSECYFDSGSVTIAIFKDGESEAARNLKFEAAAGVYTVTDVDTGEEVADYEVEACTLEDFKEAN